MRRGAPKVPDFTRFYEKRNKTRIRGRGPARMHPETIEFISLNTMLMVPELGDEPRLSQGLAHTCAQAYARKTCTSPFFPNAAHVRMHVAAGAPGPI